MKMRMHNFIIGLIGALVSMPASSAERCPPPETGPANVPEQEPTFPGQTRACEAKSNAELVVTVLADGLVHPWAVEPLPGGDLLITERPGRMRVVRLNGQVGEPLAGIPEVHAQGQGGLLDVALSPHFERDNTIFWSYSEPREEGNGTSVARGRLLKDQNRVEDVRVIFRALPAYANDAHYGSRLSFDKDGVLYVTLGERFDMQARKEAQDLDSHFGTLVRIHPDGSVPEDNPFVNTSGALPEIWTLGHRNVQAAGFDADGQLWIVEHGPQGGDEVNLIRRGENYGWPLVAYGEQYSGEPLPNAKTQRPGYVQPVYYWDPVIAPSGMQFYSGKAVPEWKGDLFVGGMVERALVRLELEDGRVVGEEHLLKERERRIRDVREGENGELYVVTDHDDGELWKVEARD